MITLIAAVWVTGLATVAVAQMVDGEITKVDEAAGKMTIRHGPLKKFDMDAMAMVFRASDPARLNPVKPGEQVLFIPDKVTGRFTVIKLEKKKYPPPQRAPCAPARGARLPTFDEPRTDRRQQEALRCRTTAQSARRSDG